MNHFTGCITRLHFQRRLARAPGLQGTPRRGSTATSRAAVAGCSPSLLDGYWWFNYYDGFMMVLWWFYDGFMMVLWWFYDGFMMVLWWFYDGFMMVNHKYWFVNVDYGLTWMVKVADRGQWWFMKIDDGRWSLVMIAGWMDLVWLMDSLMDDWLVDGLGNSGQKMNVADVRRCHQVVTEM